MAMNYAAISNPSKVTIPQTQPLDNTQVVNSAGGYVYSITPWDHLQRFLILGASGGTFYASEQKHVKQNSENLEKCLSEDGIRFVNAVVSVSTENKAVKNAPAIFALALAAAKGSKEVKKAALMNLDKVARQSTDFFSFLDQYKTLGGGWGSMTRKAVAHWYQSKAIDSVAYQMIKYRQRDGWTHHDVLHLAHVKPANTVESNLYGFAKGLATGDASNYKLVLLPDYAMGFLAAQSASSAKEVAKLITEFRLPREAVPTEFLNDAKVWDALLQSMPATALIRNLGKMTQVGLVTQLSTAERLIVEKLHNSDWLSKSRVHPISVLLALKIYAQGKGDKGSLVWKPSQKIVDALDDAFYASFKNVVPTGKNINLALDVSGSMAGGYGGYGYVQSGPLSPREVTAAMALVTAATEENYIINAFSGRFIELDITPKMRLDQVMKKISGLPFESTDCSLPMLNAMSKNLPIDAFVVYTDNETYCGSQHPSEALQQYRKKSGRNAKLAVVATTATNFTIADPKDPGMLDIAGFSADVPNVLSSFIGG